MADRECVEIWVDDSDACAECEVWECRLRVRDGGDRERREKVREVITAMLALIEHVPI